MKSALHKSTLAFSPWPKHKRSRAENTDVVQIGQKEQKLARLNSPPIQTSTTTTLTPCSASAPATHTAVHMELVLQGVFESAECDYKCWSFNGSLDLPPLILQQVYKDLQQPSVARTSVSHAIGKINEW